MTQGGGAIPIAIPNDARPAQGGAAIPVAVVSGRGAIGGAALPVQQVLESEVASGAVPVQGGAPLPIVDVTSVRSVAGGPVQRVYVVSGLLSTPPLLVPTSAWLASRGIAPGTVGGLIDSWTDVYGRVATSSGTTRPTYRTVPRAKLQFDAVNDQMILPGTLGSYVSTGAGLIVIAMRPGGNIRYAFQDTNGALGVLAGTNGTAAVELNLSAQTASRPAGLGLPYIVAVWWQGGQTRIMVNNGAVSSVASPGPVNVSGLVVSNFTAGDLYGIVTSATAGDATEARARAVTTWLAAQTGLTITTVPPPAIAGLAGWLDARTLFEAATAEASVVATLIDSSGLARTGTGIGSPTYRATALNGRPAVRLGAAANQFLRQNGVAGTVSGNDTPFTAFLAGTLRTAGSTGILWMAANNTGQAYIGVRAENISGTVRWRVVRRGDSGGAIGVAATGTLTDTNPHVFEIVYAGTSVELLLDGLSIASGSLDTVAATLNNCAWGGGLIASSGTATSNAPLDLGAGLVYAGVLSSSNRATIRAQLGQAFGITVL